MTYFDNGSFMEQLDPEFHIERKSNIATFLAIGLLISTASALHFYIKMKEYQEELASKGH